MAQVNRHQAPQDEAALSQVDAPQPLRRDAVENRERILAAARCLISELGIEAVSMHRVAQAAGVGQATLYRHYAHKGDLCRGLMQESGERAIEEFESFWRASVGRPALERLDGVIKRVVLLFEEKLPYLAAIDDACAGQLRTSKFKHPFYLQIHGIIAGLLNDAQTQGEIPPSNANFMTDAVMAALGPDMYQFQREERGLSQEQIIEGVRRLYT